MRKKIKDIELLRGLAVMMVIVAHTPYLGKYIKPLFLQTWTGVDLFFVISGCVVSLTLLADLPEIQSTDFLDRFKAYRLPLKNFFIKRFFRITPLSIIWAFIPLACAFYFNTSSAFATRTFYQAFNQLLGIITLQFNYLYIYRLVPYELGYYWSLTVEEHFYLLLPIFFLLVPSDSARIKWSIFFIALITFLIRPLFPIPGDPTLDTWHWMRFASHNRFDSLFLGVILGLIHFHESDTPVPRSHSIQKFFMLALIVLLCLVPGMQLSPQLLGFQITIINLICFVLVYFASQDKDFLDFHRSLTSVMVYLGSRSYALYLIHYPSYKMTEEIFFRISLDSIPFKIVTFCLLTWSLAELSHRLIEIPFMKMGKKFIIKS